MAPSGDDDVDDEEEGLGWHTRGYRGGRGNAAESECCDSIQIPPAFPRPPRSSGVPSRDPSSSSSTSSSPVCATSGASNGTLLLFPAQPVLAPPGGTGRRTRRARRPDRRPRCLLARWHAATLASASATTMTSAPSCDIPGIAFKSCFLRQLGAATLAIETKSGRLRARQTTESEMWHSSARLWPAGRT